MASNGGRHPTGCGHLTAAGKHIPHYVFDLWAHQWRRRYATGNVVMVRYADDIVIGFDKRYDARRFRIAMQRRLREFGLTVHPEKTRLMEFGASLPKTVPSGEKANQKRSTSSGSRTSAGKIATAGSC
uniref:Retron-type RNA-directed DNA polymerase n=1 Tax=Klebsiella pneumoniae TaxID=573 RepID=A0A482M6T8_KLEPN|nr:Retron-type RNA-directed DNA polymerase [Klebsiella pneumoniae]